MSALSDVREWGDEMDWDRDWDVKPTVRFRRTPSDSMPVIADPKTPCWLCEPGYVCAFHREEA